MARKTCISCDTRKAVEGDLCTRCNEYAEWENTHSDHDHETIAATKEGMLPKGWLPRGSRGAKRDAALEQVAHERTVMADCQICQGVEDPANDRTPVEAKERRVGYRRAQLNHKGHTHPQTPAARRACKKAFWAAVGELTKETTPTVVAKYALGWDTTFDGKVAKQIQPGDKPSTPEAAPTIKPSKATGRRTTATARADLLRQRAAEGK